MEKYLNKEMIIFIMYNMCIKYKCVFHQIANIYILAIIRDPEEILSLLYFYILYLTIDLVLVKKSLYYTK